MSVDLFKHDRKLFRYLEWEIFGSGFQDGGAWRGVRIPEWFPSVEDGDWSYTLCLDGLDGGDPFVGTVTPSVLAGTVRVVLESRNPQYELGVSVMCERACRRMVRGFTPGFDAETAHEILQVAVAGRVVPEFPFATISQ